MLRSQISPNASQVIFFGYSYRWLRGQDYSLMPAWLLRQCDPIQRQLLGDSANIKVRSALLFHTIRVLRSRPLRQGSSVKVTGLAQKLAQLEAVNRDLQSKSWANLNILGQPCNFYASRPVPRTPRGSGSRRRRTSRSRASSSATRAGGTR